MTGEKTFNKGSLLPLIEIPANYSLSKRKESHSLHKVVAMEGEPTDKQVMEGED